MKKILIISAAILSVSGCTSVPTNSQADYQEFSIPELNTPVEVHVGESMIDQGKATTANVLSVRNEVGGSLYQIPRGDYLEKGVDSQGRVFFELTNRQGAQVTRGSLSDPQRALYVNRSGKVCVTTDFMIEGACYESDLNVGEKTMFDNNSFRQLLVYSGSVGDKINISYRELSNNLARGSFNNNVEYDMSKSMTIRYKGAEIEVIEYNNMSIKYIVRKHIRPDIAY